MNIDNINKPAAIATAKIIGLAFLAIFIVQVIFAFIPPIIISLCLVLAAVCFMIKLIYDDQVYRMQFNDKKTKGE